jgi:hypothetical protein
VHFTNSQGQTSSDGQVTFVESDEYHHHQYSHDTSPIPYPARPVHPPNYGYQVYYGDNIPWQSVPNLEATLKQPIPSNYYPMADTLTSKDESSQPYANDDSDESRPPLPYRPPQESNESKSSSRSSGDTSSCSSCSKSQVEIPYN